MISRRTFLHLLVAPVMLAAKPPKPPKPTPTPRPTRTPQPTATPPAPAAPIALIAVRYAGSFYAGG